MGEPMAQGLVKGINQAEEGSHDALENHGSEEEEGLNVDSTRLTILTYRHLEGRQRLRICQTDTWQAPATE
jgi:hypothetical protein